MRTIEAWFQWADASLLRPGRRSRRVTNKMCGQLAQGFNPDTGESIPLAAGADAAEVEAILRAWVASRNRGIKSPHWALPPGDVGIISRVWEYNRCSHRKKVTTMNKLIRKRIGSVDHLVKELRNLGLEIPATKRRDLQQLIRGDRWPPKLEVELQPIEEERRRAVATAQDNGSPEGNSLTVNVKFTVDTQTKDLFERLMQALGK